MKYLYKEANSSKYYLLLDGALRHIPDAAFKRIWKTQPLGAVTEVSITDKKASTGHAVGVALPESTELLRAPHAPEVFLVYPPGEGMAPVRRHVVNEAQLYDMFQAFENVSVVATMADINKYALGLPLSNDKSPFAEVAKHDVYTYAGADNKEHICAVVVPLSVYSTLAGTEVRNKLIADEIYSRFKDEFDFLMLVPGKNLTDGEQPIFGMTSNRGARSGIREASRPDAASPPRIDPSRLRATMTLTSAKNLYNGAFLHEIAHGWAQYIVTTWGYAREVANGPFQKYLTGAAPLDHVFFSKQYVDPVTKKTNTLERWEKKKPQSRYTLVRAGERASWYWQDNEDPTARLMYSDYGPWGIAPLLSADEPDWDFTREDTGHWGISSANGELGGYATVQTSDAGGGRQRASAPSFHYNNTGANSREYSNIELWLMGLATRQEIDALSLDVWEQIRDYAQADGKVTWTGVKKTYTYSASDQNQNLKARRASATSAPEEVYAPGGEKRFNVLTVIVTEHVPTADEWRKADAYLRWFTNPTSDDTSALPDRISNYTPKNFASATRKRATMNSQISGWPDCFRMR